MRLGRLASVLLFVVLVGSAGAGYAAAHSPYFLLAGLVAAVVVVLFVSSSWLGLGTLMAVSFFEDMLPSVEGLPSLVKLVGVLVIGSWMMRRLLGLERRPLRMGAIEIGMIIFAGIGLVSLAGATDFMVGAAYYTRYIMFFVLAVIVADHIGSARDVERIVFIILLAAAAAAVVGGFEFVFGSAFRVQGPLEDPNDLGYALSMAFALGLFSLVRRQGSGRWVMFVLLCVVSVGIIGTLSRGTLAGVAAGVAWGVLLGRVRVRYLVAGFLTVALVTMAVYFIDPARISFAFEMKQNFGGVTVGQRLDRWRIALQMFEDRPILGVGVGNYGVLYKSYGGTELIGHEGTKAHHVAHNMYLEVAAETGTLGFLVFVFILAAALRAVTPLGGDGRDETESSRAPPAPSAESVLGDRWPVLLGSVSTAMITLMAGGLFLTEQYFAPLWVVVGLASGLHRLSEGLAVAQTPGLDLGSSSRSSGREHSLVVE